MTLVQCGLLEQQHHREGQEEAGQGHQEVQLCPGLFPGHSAAGGGQEGPGQTNIYVDHDCHPLQDTLSALESSFSDRLIHPHCVKERFRRSFLPAAVRLYNENC